MRRRFFPAFISGQTAWDTQKRIVGGSSLLEQARQALRNVQAATEAVGGTLKDIVKRYRCTADLYRPLSGGERGSGAVLD